MTRTTPRARPSTTVASLRAPLNIMASKPYLIATRTSELTAARWSLSAAMRTCSM